MMGRQSDQLNMVVMDLSELIPNNYLPHFTTACF